MVELQLSYLKDFSFVGSPFGKHELAYRILSAQNMNKTSSPSKHRLLVIGKIGVCRCGGVCDTLAK